jgi:hypothetical protein
MLALFSPRLIGEARRAVFAAVTVFVAALAPAQSETTFTYQGVLNFEGEPFTGSADYRFSLWDAPADGNQIGSESVVNEVNVDGGLFTAALDFGAEAHGPGRHLQIAVRTPAWDGSGDEPGFFTFPDRTAMTASPYALNTRGIFVNESGDRIGIGTDDPTHPLHVSGDDRTTMLVESPNQFGTWLNLLNTSPGGRFWRMISTGSGNGEGPGNLLLGHGNAATTHTSVMTMTPTGNVGIGTTSPQDRLDLGSGALRFPDDTRQTTAYRPIVRNTFLTQASISGGGQLERGISGIAGAEPGMTVIVTPPYRLWPFHTIGYAYVESPGFVVFSIVSTAGPDRVYGAGTWRFTIIP